MTTALARPAASRWQASLDLKFARTTRGCRLVASAHNGPLYVQKPFYPEGPDLAHVYLLHPPGGLVSGDSLEISVALGKDASVLVTTPGAGRVYRAREDRTLQWQRTRMVLSQGANIEYFPQETIIYPGASAGLETRVELSDRCHYAGWEITCLGLPASELEFDSGEFRQHLGVFRDGRPLIVENFVLNEGSRSLYDASVGLRGQPVMGLMVAGPFAESRSGETAEIVTSLRAVTASCKPGMLCNVSVFNGFVTVRYLGSSSAEAREIFIQCWQLLRPLLLGREHCPPRIWAT
ncbi:MAG: urease accessory protein UreD [Pseudomonadota bacterium]|nr:urease accessory protein [Pseudohongiella sp.]MAY57271.1 urease accessory protein [Gammaproteobacteria bacterium]MBJ53822.1 urease accessory protein [Gammaproteobacteria bacterium]MEC8859468.1 urease accessory protein UreD [Pseudomonadota bacterium]|tara:strand:- start:4693 stop:5571 length:879 start_codon:yes stop_codon:yes gene_type:complete